MKKTRILALLLALALLASCQAKEKEDTSPAPAPAETPTQETPAAPKEEAQLSGEVLLAPETFAQLRSMDFDLLEEQFYGSWKGENDNFKLTYQEDSLVLGNTRVTGLGEDEDHWYMEIFAGGAGQLYVINKAEPDTMYYYCDWTAMQPAMTDYDQRYQRDKGAESSTEIGAGPISASGVQKLESLLGEYLWDIGTEVTCSDGSQWIALDALCLPAEEISLVEAPTESRLHFTRGLYPAGSDAEEMDESGKTVRTPITITAEKQGEQWVVTQAEVAAN